MRGRYLGAFRPERENEIFDIPGSDQKINHDEKIKKPSTI
jgi:hypothetical protein